jgi:hypothetical protein
MAVETINIAKELKSGRHYGVFIDDTGSPGLKTPGLDEQRKSWVAVFVAPSRIAEVMDEMPKALAFLSELGLNNPEFHFTNIWAGRGEFEKLSLQERLAIFGFMAHIFTAYRFDGARTDVYPRQCFRYWQPRRLAQTFWPTKIQQP